jgi:hypothetical protein
MGARRPARGGFLAGAGSVTVVYRVRFAGPTTAKREGST